MGKHKVVRSEEHKQRIAAALKAAWTPERRAELAEKRRGELNPFYGTEHSAQWKREASERLKGERNPFYGRQHTAEYSEHQSNVRRGRSARLKKYGVSEEEYAERRAKGERWCYYHRGFAPANQFTSPERKKAPSSVCIACSPAYNREQHLQGKFNVDENWFTDKFKEQGEVCAVCGVHAIAKRKRFMCIDHDHVTGQLRGILCAKCNTSIERLETVANWALLAANYLMQYPREARCEA